MGFYGHPDVAKRSESWGLLKILAQFNPIPWICMGDFNETLSPSEKWGGSLRIRSQMRGFQQALEQCELTELNSFGPKFTWSNCREGMDFIKEKLDRGVANQEWRDLFPNAEIKVEFSMGSDHLPIFLLLRLRLLRHKMVFRKIISVFYGVY